jgi:hypothetical protein
MSARSGDDGGVARASGPLVLVCVEDTIEPALSGHAGAVYHSPPQSHEQALALVRLLVGHPVDVLADGDSWRVAVAGGRRIVTIRAGWREPTVG